jgi:hypothetical protein
LRTVIGTNSRVCTYTDCCQSGYSWNLIVYYSYSLCEVAVLLFPSVAVQVTVFGPFTKLAGERVTVTVVQYQALGG